MVRTLDSSLISALSSVARRPAVTLTIEDHVIHYASYQTPGTADALNDACIAADNSIIRVQLPRGLGFASSLQVQRVTDPSQAAQWATWTALPGSSGVMFQDGGCAVSNSDGLLRAFAQRGTGGNDLWVWTSTTNGVSWTGPVSVLVPPGGALLRGISSASNYDVFFLYDVSGGEAIGCSFNTGGNWSHLTTWSLSPLVFGSGLCAAWTGSMYVIVYSDGYTLYSCIFNPSTSTWASSTLIAPATSTAIGRVGPRISFADGLYTLSCVELDSGALTGSVYSYPRLRQSSDLVHWSNGLIVHDFTASYGITAFKLLTPNSGSSGARYYLASPTTVFSAPAFQSSSASQYIDVSAAVLSYQRLEQPGKPARLEVTLDNANGLYNSFVTNTAYYEPIGLNASLVLSEGYKTGTPPTTSDVVKVGTYHITHISFVRAPNEHKLYVVGLDASRVLDLVVRYQNSYMNQALSYLVTEVCARAGLYTVQLPTTSQMSQTIPSFVVQAGQTYRHALDELCTTYGLYYFLDQNEVMQFRELSTGDISVWSYQPEIETVTFGSNDLRANHVIVSGKPPVGGNIGALTTAEAFDDAHVHLIGLEQLRHHVDQKLTTTTQCSQKATLLLAQEVRSQTEHTVTVPLNPALQMYDVVTLTDSAAPTGSGQLAICRIARINVHFDAQHALNEQQLTLEGL